MIIIIFLIVSYILLSISLYMLFPKADVSASKGLIPGVNLIEWAKLIGRPAWWPVLLLIPIVNIFIFAGMAVNLMRSFGKYGLGHSAASVLYTPAAFAWLAKIPTAKYIGKNFLTEKEYKDELKQAIKDGDSRKVNKLKNNSPYSKSIGREWFESIVFAVFAASFIRMFLMEAFVIPTPSMEGSLLVGDYLFVSKPAYGLRMPQTLLQLPLMHNRIPLIKTESYLKKPSLDYTRLGSIDNLTRNKPIVFNWPVGDTCYVTSSRPYAAFQARDIEYRNRDRELARMYKNNDFVVRPVDKRDHYVKRCVGMPGDSLQIINRQLYINGSPAKNPAHLQYLHSITWPQGGFNRSKLKDWGITSNHLVGNRKDLMHLDKEQVANLEAVGCVVKPYPQSVNPTGIFPRDPKHYRSWSVDNFGPIYIPQAGATVKLSKGNIALYRRIINTYEGNELKETAEGFIINGQSTDSYTFEQNYYWAMGDNRHNSEDSRMWGYVPEDHVVGKPLFIWFSTREGSITKGIRFNRMFKSADVE